MASNCKRNNLDLWASEAVKVFAITFVPLSMCCSLLNKKKKRFTPPIWVRLFSAKTPLIIAVDATSTVELHLMAFAFFFLRFLLLQQQQKNRHLFVLDRHLFQLGTDQVGWLWLIVRLWLKIGLIFFGLWRRGFPPKPFGTHQRQSELPVETKERTKKKEFLSNRLDGEQNRSYKIEIESRGTYLSPFFFSFVVLFCKTSANDDLKWYFFLQWVTRHSSGFQGNQWAFIEFYWVLPSFLWFYWVLLGITEFHRVWPSVTGFHQVSLDFTGFYWIFLVVLGFTEFDQVLLLDPVKSNCDILDFTEFYWILLGFTGFYWFYWVLPSLTKFYSLIPWSPIAIYLVFTGHCRFFTETI